MGIADRAAARALDKAREIEEQMDALKQKHEAKERQMKDTIQVLRKTVIKRTAEAKDLRERIAKIADDSNRMSHEYSEKLKSTEKALRQAEREARNAEKRLQESRDSFNRRMTAMRENVKAARKEAKAQQARANRLHRRLWVYGTRVMDERISRAIRGKLSINSKTHDIAMLEEPMYYVYYLMHNGQNRRYSTTVSTESMPDLDWELENLRAGLADGMTQMDSDGNAMPVTVDLGHVDADGRPVVAYSGNLSAYRYNRRNIPERLRNHLQQSTIDEIEKPGQLEWKALTIGAKRDIYRAVTALKAEAAISRSEMADPVMEERRRVAREAAKTVMGADIGEITDEMRDITKQWMLKKDSSYNGTPTDDEVWDFISKHPDQYLNSIKPSGLKNKKDSLKLSFFKIQRIARILDGGKDDGPFQRIFVRAFQDSYDNVLQNIDRRTNAFSEALEGIIGKKGSKGYSSRMEELRSSTVHFRSNAVNGEGFDATLMQVMAMYIYSQNINGATKLVSVDGNNLSMEDLARINPQKTLEYLALEEQMRADPGRDADHPTPFNGLQDIEALRRKIEKEEIVSVVPDWVRDIGDMMIDQLAMETPRVAEAAYQHYNVMLEIQDRYFPLVQASRGSWGNMFGSPFKGGTAQVDSGSLKVRQKNARYPLSLDPFSVFMSAIREQENLIGMSKPVSDASYLLKFGRIGDVVSNRFGSKWAKALDDYVKRIANPENHLTDVEKMMNRILGNAAAAKIGLNLMTGIKQFVSLIPAMADGQLSPLDVLRGFTLAVPHRKETAELMDRLAYSTLRSGYNVDISRMQNMDDTTRFGQASQKFIDISTWLAQQGDQISKMIVWSAMYDKQLRAGKSEADAAYMASDLVNRTMSVTTPISLSEMQSSRNPFARIMFMFTNDLFQMWNIIFADIPMDFRNRDWGRMFQRFAGVVMSAAALGFLAGGWLPDKDDDEPFSIDDFIGDFIENMLGYSVPLAGQLASEWARGYSQSLITLPSEVVRTGSMVYQDLRGNKEISADQYFDQIIDTLMSGGELVGVPTTGLKRPAQSVYDFDTGEFRLNLAYLFGARWGEGAPNLLALIMN